MKVEKKRKLAAAGVLVALGGCTSPYEGEGEREERGEVVCVEEMFVEVGAEGGKRETEFRTNDKRYWRWEGVTVWTVWGEEGVEEEFEGRTVEMGKVAGDAGGGYGIVLCQGEREVGGKEEKTMLVVMINNRGEYLIGEVVGSRGMGGGRGVSI
jgi:hypothetical protein